MDIPVVFLINESNRELETATAVMGVFKPASSNSSPGFGLYGVPDGVYELRLSSSLSSSAPLRITVNGADVTGLNLRLLRTNLISGRVVIEQPKPGQERREKSGVEEILLRIRNSDAADRSQGDKLTAINEKGDFVQPLEDGVYRIIADLPGDNWYVKAITRTAKETPNETVDVARDGVAVKAGGNITGIEVMVAEGAAILRGRIAVADETQTKERAPRWRVRLVPAEETAAEDVLRYAETVAQSDASFELKHIAPGKYYLLAQKISEKEPIKNRSHPPAWDNVERAKLRNEAQALKQEIELRPYQRINDYLLRDSPDKR
jgi:hypothetical protein